MGLLSGLEKLGIKNVDQVELYEKEAAKKVVKEEKKETEDPAKKAPVSSEKDYLLVKTYECPACGKKFKDLTLKSNKARLLSTDLDLRPRYETIEPLKYEAVLCPNCGYAAIGRYFGFLSPTQKKFVAEQVSANYEAGNEIGGDTYTYEQALKRNQMCLLNAIVKKGKASEKAYICLKSGWLVRCMQEDLDPEAEDYEEQKKRLTEQEDEFLQGAMDGFIEARTKEGVYPMCGMDEMTLDFLISVLALRFDQLDVSSKLIATILTSTSASQRLKEKAREVKDLIIRRINEKKKNG